MSGQSQNAFINKALPAGKKQEKETKFWLNLLSKWKQTAGKGTFEIYDLWKHK